MNFAKYVDIGQLSVWQNASPEAARGALIAASQLAPDRFGPAAAEALAKLWVSSAKQRLGRSLSMYELQNIAFELRKHFDSAEGYGLGSLMEELKAPARPSTAELERRLGLYAGNSDQAYWAANRASSRMAWEIRIFDASMDVKHCKCCIDYALAGPQPKGQLPLPGSGCECLGNCKCQLLQISSADAANWDRDWGETLRNILALNKHTDELYDSSL